MAFDKKELKKKSQNISDWYNDVVLKAELADYGPARGTMVFRPYGYAIWERAQSVLDRMFKEGGVANAYFPLFIPYSLLEKEKEHVEGFAPELALVTIGGGKKLKEPLAVRPTSETIMYEMYAKWISSWRDLPVKINQWNNAVRWEKRTYLFLRTSEFLWQEGHCAHATHEESLEMTLRALDWYQKTYEDFYAMPVLVGVKSKSETFAGADRTFTVESLMPDGKALQACTSHDLGQNFSRPQNISFQNKEGKTDFVWQNSWGFSTRSIGGLIMTHGDDHGLILPPKIAPIQVVIVPIYSQKSQRKVLAWAQEVADELKATKIRVHLDDRDWESAGRKFNEWELKGVPLRLEVGEKEAAEKSITLVRRDETGKTRTKNLGEIKGVLKQIQKNLFTRAKSFLAKNIHDVETYEEFKKIMKEKRGFIKAFWCEEENCEAKIKEETKATTRLRPLEAKPQEGKCIYCGRGAQHKWYFAQAY